MTGAWWDGALGRRARLKRTFSEADIASYGALTGDFCLPDEIPEPLVAGMFSALLGVHLPGRGTNYLKQTLRPRSPARPGEQVEASVEVVRVVPEKRLVYLTTICTGADGRIVAEGQALVLAGGVPAP